MRESLIENAVVDYAKKRGFNVRKCRWIGRDGAPDRLFFGKGRALWIEFKAFGKQPTARQKREHARMRRNGMEVYVIDDIATGCGIIDAKPV
jgi:hypothetical protein